MGCKSLEIWKSVPGYDNRYEVSNLGNIRRVHESENGMSYVPMLPQKAGHADVCQVILRNDKRQRKFGIHQLVAAAFVPNPNGYKHVIHLNGIASNNRAENLAWSSTAGGNRLVKNDPISEEELSSIHAEEWKPAPGFEGIYEVSKEGHVRILYTDIDGNMPRSLLLTARPTSVGFSTVHLYRDGRKFVVLVHRLVAQAFLENPNNLPYVSHIDGDLNNNAVDNLEWSAPKSKGQIVKLVKSKNQPQDIEVDNEDEPSDESWLPIFGYEDRYEVSDKGRVRSFVKITTDEGEEFAYRYLTLRTTKSSVQVTLSSNGKSRNASVANLVATAFIPNPNSYKYVVHINGDKSDNTSENLLWSERVIFAGRTNFNFENLENESWVPVTGYEDRYEVSDKGRVREKHADGRYSIKSGYVSKQDGNRRIWLRAADNNKLVQVKYLVAHTFVPNPQKKSAVSHLDGNKLNVAAENLIWI